jgi:hypothetical protein
LQGFTPHGPVSNYRLTVDEDIADADGDTFYQGMATMVESDSKTKQTFEQLFAAMRDNEQVAEVALSYLHETRGVDKAIIYNELLAKKLIGYAAERKALAFPLVRGFLYVGIQYVPVESLKIDGLRREAGDEYCHEGSDLETGLFSLQKRFGDVMVTNGIVDLLSTGREGVSLPSLSGLKQLQLFAKSNTTVCFKNIAGRDAAIQSVRKILPQAAFVTLPKQFKDINHLLVEKGATAVASVLGTSKEMDVMKRTEEPMENKTLQIASCRYFAEAGPQNTAVTLEAARERAETLKIGKIVLSSCTGKTAFTALDLFGNDFSLVVVTHSTGFQKPDYQELSEKDRDRLTKRGAAVLTAQHAFGGVGRAFRNKTGTYQMDELIAYTLRTFGQGTKVAVEIALMAADAGLIRTDEDVISIGGTGQGVDTALVLKPAHTQNFFDLKVKQIICKPEGF